MINFLCLVYYICSSMELIPAIARMIRRKSSHDYSIISAVMSMVGTSCWSIYIACTEQTLVVYIGTLTDLILVMVYFVVILLFWKNTDNKEMTEHE